MNLLFDLDGTLTDPREGIVGSLRHALQTMGGEVPDDAVLAACIGPPLRDSFRQLLPVADERGVDAAIAAYREVFAVTGLFQNHVYPGIPEVLAGLIDRGATLYIATSKPHVYARQILEHFALNGFFADLFGAELDGTRSAKHEVITQALGSAGLDPRQTVMIGDRSHDIVGAVRCGVRPVGVLWGYGSRHELLDAGAELLLERVADVATLVR